MAIQVSNLKSGDTITYSLPLVIGEVVPLLAQGHIIVECLDGGGPITWPVLNGQFKALVQLVPGKNNIQFKYYESILQFTLFYKLPDFTKFIRPVYIVCEDDDGLFQGPEDEDTSAVSACNRIALGSKLLQTFIAEKIHEHGLGRKTFVLENDVDPAQPGCHVFRSCLSMEAVHSMSGTDLWMHFAKELMGSKKYRGKESCKWLAFMSFTRYKPPDGVVPRSHSEILSNTKGHTALGTNGICFILCYLFQQSDKRYPAFLLVVKIGICKFFGR